MLKSYSTSLLQAALIILSLISTSAFGAGFDKLQLAIATCDVETTSKLLKAGADPNGVDAEKKPIVRWLASNSKCKDATALSTTKLLDEHGSRFDSGGEPSLLISIAQRRLPHTLEFLTKKGGAGDPSRALRAIAKKGDLESVKILLAAGANPLINEGLTSALFDAAAEGRTQLVKEMLESAKDKQAPAVLAAYDIARKNDKSETEQAFLDAGVEPKPEAKPQELPCERRTPTEIQAQLMKKLKIHESCKFVQECGDLILIDCDSAADGPAYYVNQKLGSIVASCGGECMKGCPANCPPKEWTCSCRL